MEICIKIKGEDCIFSEEIGSGGFGKILKGQNTVTNEILALKIIPIPSKEHFEIYRREIDITTQLQNENIVKVYFADFSPEIDAFRMVMPYYKNGSLRTYLYKTKDFLSYEDAIFIFKKILTGFLFAHSKNIIHRDIKPDNILVTDDNNFVISDFGLAKYATNATQTMTFKGKGTVLYMAPECISKGPNTIQMDIYSLGIMFYEILTKTFPFIGSVEDIVKKHLYEPVPNISNIRTDIPTKLKEIINKMTEKKIEDRYNNCEEILEDINTINLSNYKNNTVASIISAKSFEDKKKISDEEVKKQEFQDFLDSLKYSVKYLCNDIKDQVSNVNYELVNDQIKVFESTDEQGFNNLLLTQKNNRFDLFFFPIKSIANFNKEYHDNSIRRQIAKHGMVLMEPGKTFFQENNIVLVGCIFINDTPDKSCNIVLEKKKEEPYGTWYILTYENKMTSQVGCIPEEEYFFDLYQKAGASGLKDRHIIKYDKSKINEWLINLVQ